MSFDSAPITVRIPLSIELTRGVSQTITAPLYRDGAAVAATAVDATVYDSAGQEVTIGTSAAIVSDVASWTLTPASTLTLDTGYRIEWDVTHAGGIERAHSSAAIVRRAIQPRITDADLFRRDPMLNPAEAGYILAESSANLQDYIDEAWTEVLGRVWAQGNRPALIMSPESLRSPHLYKTAAILYRTVRTTEALELAAEYESMYEMAWSSLRWVYDSNDDGAPDEEGQMQAGTPVMWTA